MNQQQLFEFLTASSLADHQHLQIQEMTNNQHQQGQSYGMLPIDPYYYYNTIAFQEINMHGVVDTNNVIRSHQMQQQHHTQPTSQAPSLPTTLEDFSGTSCTSTPSTSPSSQASLASSVTDFNMTCENCGKVLSSLKRYQNHYQICFNKTNNPQIFICTHCGYEFLVKKSYEKHMRREHGEPSRVNCAIQPANCENNPPRNPSIFHSIALLAQSDAK